MIRFTDSADSILEYPMSRVILIDASLQSKDAVIDRIEKALEAPYNEDNWDGFRDAIGNSDALLQGNRSIGNDMLDD